MNIYSFLLSIILILILLIPKIVKHNKINKDIIELNKKNKQELEESEKKLEEVLNKINVLNNSIEEKEKINEILISSIEDKKKIAKEEIEKAKKEYLTEYSNIMKDLSFEISNECKSLEDLVNKRKTLIQASIREKEIKEKENFYKIKIDDIEKNDIKILNSIKDRLTNKRVLNMLIWQTWYRDKITALCNNIIGTTTKSGIYKITNIITNEAYIGQSCDLSARFKQHAKCGIGIDTPQNNKLYNAMQKYGLENFTWEILEYCDNKNLDQKEKYYISTYQTYDYGYNSNQGRN